MICIDLLTGYVIIYLYQQTKERTMKSNSVRSKLGKFKSVSDSNGAIWYYSRNTKNKNRYVKMIDQGNGKCIALPVFQDDDGSVRVAFHATTIKSLMEFLSE